MARKASPVRITTRVGWRGLGPAVVISCGLSAAGADEWTIHPGDPSGNGPRLSGLQLAEEPSYDSSGNEFWPSLMVRCSIGGIEIAINWQIPVAGNTDNAPVVTRLDDGPARAEGWRLAPDTRYTLKVDPGGWLHRLLLAHRLSARAASGDGESIETNFDLDGLATVAEKMSGACPR